MFYRIPSPNHYLNRLTRTTPRTPSIALRRYRWLWVIGQGNLMDGQPKATMWRIYSPFSPWALQAGSKYVMKSMYNYASSSTTTLDRKWCFWHVVFGKKRRGRGTGSTHFMIHGGVYMIEQALKMDGNCYRSCAQQSLPQTNWHCTSYSFWTIFSNDNQNPHRVAAPSPPCLHH